MATVTEFIEAKTAVRLVRRPGRVRDRFEESLRILQKNDLEEDGLEDVRDLVMRDDEFPKPLAGCAQTALCAIEPNKIAA